MMSQRSRELQIVFAAPMVVCLGIQGILRAGEAPVPRSGGNAVANPGAPAAPSPAALGIKFLDNSSSTLVIEREGRRYLVDVAAKSIREVGPEGPGLAGGTPIGVAYHPPAQQ